jgi:hypothetical protein
VSAALAAAGADEVPRARAAKLPGPGRLAGPAAGLRIPGGCDGRATSCVPGREQSHPPGGNVVPCTLMPMLAQMSNVESILGLIAAVGGMVFDQSLYSPRIHRQAPIHRSNREFRAAGVTPTEYRDTRDGRGRRRADHKAHRRFDGEPSGGPRVYRVDVVPSARTGGHGLIVRARRRWCPMASRS